MLESYSSNGLISYFTMNSQRYDEKYATALDPSLALRRKITRTNSVVFISRDTRQYIDESKDKLRLIQEWLHLSRDVMKSDNMQISKSNNDRFFVKTNEIKFMHNTVQQSKIRYVVMLKRVILARMTLNFVPLPRLPLHWSTSRNEECASSEWKVHNVLHLM